MLTARVTSKGQITIPKKVRERLGIGRGETIGFYEKEGVFYIRKSGPAAPFEKWLGRLKGQKRKKTDAIIEELRGK